MNIRGESEDKIWKAKLIIGELEQMKEQYYETLSDEIIDDLVEDSGASRAFIEDHLFDYIHNCDDDESFSDYMDHFENRGPSSEKEDREFLEKICESASRKCLRF